MFELVDAYSQSAVIKVIGVGGGGGNDTAKQGRASGRQGPVHGRSSDAVEL